jgi:serine/threonine-protein kinase
MGDSDDNSKALLPETTLNDGKYHILKVLGRGGFGITYLARWIQTQQTGLKVIKTGEVPVVVKEFYHKTYCHRDTSSNNVLISNKEQQKEFDRLKRKLVAEAKILNSLSHKNIVEVFDAFEENNTAYIIMAYIKGSDLQKQIAEQGKLDTDKALKYIIRIASALETVHQHNILHLDISPNNILIDENDEAQLIDFGVSLSYDEGGEVKLTSKLLSGRKLGFSPPEQSSIDILKKFLPSIDIYALGATFYNCLTGQEPPESLVLLSGDEKLTPPSEINKDISPALEKIVLKSMSLNRKDRYQTAGELLADLYKEEDARKKKKLHLLLNQAKSLKAKKDYAAAFELYKQALELDPENENAKKGIEQTQKAMEEIAEQQAAREKRIQNLQQTQIMGEEQTENKTDSKKTRKKIPAKTFWMGLFSITLLLSVVSAFLFNPKESKPQSPAESTFPAVNDSIANDTLSVSVKEQKKTGLVANPDKKTEPQPKTEASQPNYLQLANTYFNDGKYALAKENYEKYSVSDPANTSVKNRINDSEKCLNILRNAALLFKNQEYDKAKSKYEEILNINPWDSFAKKQIQLCENQSNKQNNETEE